MAEKRPNKPIQVPTLIYGPDSVADEVGSNLKKNYWDGQGKLKTLCWMTGIGATLYMTLKFIRSCEKAGKKEQEPRNSHLPL